MRFLYVFASYLLFWVLFPVLSFHRKTRDGLAQRLGFYAPGLLPADGRPRIWLHGASAGDLLALSPMIDRLRERYPNARIILSTTTNTGHLMAHERLSKKTDAIIYSPYDLWGATQRAIAAIAPSMLVLEYTEIWPNLIRAAKRSGAKVVLTNGRFSQSRLSSYRVFFTLIENPLLDIDVFLMREEDEAERVLSLGAPRSRVFVTGNTKFDALLPSPLEQDDAALRVALGLAPGTPVWIAGSTHEGEEELLLRVYRRLRENFPALKLVIAPRYIDRADRLVGLVHEAHFQVRKRSQGGSETAPVTILDTIGELTRAYRLGTLVFVGGSFTTRGGQNILEPAAQGRPVLFGPHMENFHDSVQVLVGRGGIQVNDADHLYRVMSELLSRPEEVASLGELARSAVRQISGASQRNVEHFERLLGSVAA
ncbi:MAG: 3-deoxy-D-manno-octulosonic acid transferase [Myxococcaceae bacterium]|nr:3-deoxy-D-manno-octulosonic acid transferase [Myxococcaceae bacterium]